MASQLCSDIHYRRTIANPATYGAAGKQMYKRYADFYVLTTKVFEEKLGIDIRNIYRLSDKFWNRMKSEAAKDMEKWSQAKK